MPPLTFSRNLWSPDGASESAAIAWEETPAGFEMRVTRDHQNHQLHIPNRRTTNQGGPNVEGIRPGRRFQTIHALFAGIGELRNRNYSQWIGREELFERERASDPDWHHWNACALLADQLGEAV